MKIAWKDALVATLIAALILLLWLAWAFWSHSLASWATDGAVTASAGTWGDSFGAFNALFGALGFSAVLATLIIQSFALRTQQKDQHLQRFDTSFFQLIALMRELRAEIRFAYTAEYLKESSAKLPARRIKYGAEATTAALTEMRFWLLQRRTVSGKFTKEEIASVYNTRIHRRYESRLAPYFRLIYAILSRIKDDLQLSDQEKASYGNLLRGQLTSHEIALMAINGTSPVSKDLSDLIEYFHLLKYLPDGKTRRMLQDVYEVPAFASRD